MSVFLSVCLSVNQTSSREGGWGSKDKEKKEELNGITMALTLLIIFKP